MSIAAHQHNLYLYMGLGDNCILYLYFFLMFWNLLCPQQLVFQKVSFELLVFHTVQKIMSKSLFFEPVVKLVEVVVAVLL